MTTVRLEHGGPPEAIRKGLTNPIVRLALAHNSGPVRIEKAFAEEGGNPALLVSYWYLKGFEANRDKYHYRDWVMDSGAYSADNSGVEVNLTEYIETCRKFVAEDPKLTEVFALDVIGDWKASEKNTRKMWDAGIEAIPAFHPGEPISVLKGLAKDYPKVAIGGMVGASAKFKHRFVSEVFANVWPKKIHGFGIAGERMLMSFPFHSTDATNWEIAPTAFGTWKSFGKMSVRGGSQNLRPEVEWYLKLEQRARQKWRKEMAQLEGAE
jgi:hypothetical protein